MGWFITTKILFWRFRTIVKNNSFQGIFNEFQFPLISHIRVSKNFGNTNFKETLSMTASLHNFKKTQLNKVIVFGGCFKANTV